MASGAIRAGGAFVELLAVDKTQKAIRSAQKRLNSFSQSARAAGSVLAGIGATGSLGLGIVTKIFAGFDDTMRAVQGVTSATGKDFESLTEQAKELGRTTSFTAQQVAGAMLNLGRAGFSTDQIEASIEGILNLSRATGTELEESAGMGADLLRGFGLEVTEMTRVVDVATNATNKSNQTMTDFFEAVKLVAPVARNAGDSIEDVSAAVGVLANAGIKGSLAGTALRKSYQSLADPKIQNRLESLTGVIATTSTGELRNLTDIIADIGTATNGLPGAQKIAIFNEIFGARASGAAQVLAVEAKSVDELNRALTDIQQPASEVAKRMDSGIGGSIRRLLSGLEGIALAIGEALAGPVGELADLFSSNASAIANWIKENSVLVIGILSAIPLLGGLGAALIATGIAASTAATLLGVVASAISFLASPIGLITAGVVGLAASFLTLTEDGKQAVSVIKGEFKDLSSFVGEVYQGIQAAVNANDLGLAGDIAGKAIEVAFLSAKNNVLKIWDDLSFEMENIWDEVTTTISVGFLEMLDFLQQGQRNFHNNAKDALDNIVGGGAGTELLGEFEGADFIGQQLVEIDALDARRRERDAQLAKSQLEREADIVHAEVELENLRKEAQAAQLAAQQQQQEAEQAVSRLGALEDIAEVDSIERDSSGSSVGAFSARAAQILATFNEKRDQEPVRLQRLQTNAQIEANAILSDIFDAVSLGSPKFGF